MAKRKSPLAAARAKNKELQVRVVELRGCLASRETFAKSTEDELNKRIARHESRIVELTAKLEDAEKRACSLRAGKAVFDALGNIEQTADSQDRMLKEILPNITQQLAAYRHGLADCGKLAKEAKRRIGAAYHIDDPARPY